MGEIKDKGTAYLLREFWGVLVLPQFVHGEVTGDAGQAFLVQDASDQRTRLRLHGKGRTQLPMGQEEQGHR